MERAVQYVRGNFFAGEDFVDLADARARAVLWCREVAGLRVHGSTQDRPAEVFAAVERPVLLPAPADRYDVPVYVSAKVHRDHHIEVGKALYSPAGGADRPAGRGPGGQRPGQGVPPRAVGQDPPAGRPGRR